MFWHICQMQWFTASSVHRACFHCVVFRLWRMSSTMCQIANIVMEIIIILTIESWNNTITVHPNTLADRGKFEEEQTKNYGSTRWVSFFPQMSPVKHMFSLVYDWLFFKSFLNKKLPKKILNKNQTNPNS